jgi:hypothetical protein
MAKVYGIWANSFSNISSLWNMGFADFGIVSGKDSGPPGGFVGACNAVGATPCLQNSDSGSGGCSGDCDNYYAGLAGSGLQAVGGESEVGPEYTAIQNHLICYNMGGEGTGGASGNNDIFGGYEGARVSGYGMASYLETYTASSMISADAMGVAAAANKAAGCKEVGLLIGSWSDGDYGADASTYAAMVNAFANHGVDCAGFAYWYVQGDGSSFGGNDLSMMQQLMAWYPPIKASMKARFGGAAGTGAAPATPAQLYGGSTPTCCALGGSEVVCFVRGTTGNVYMKAYYGSAWHNWDDLGGVVGAGTGPGAASWGGQRVDLFVGGGGGAVYHKGGTTPPYGGWENLGGTTTSDCGACSDGSGNVYVFVRGSDGALWHKDYWGGKWHGWYSLGGQLLPGTGPACCSWAAGTIDVFVTGTNKNVYHIRTSGGGKWGGWQNLGGTTTSTPGCATPGSGSIALFVRGQNGALYVRGFGGGKWLNWEELGGNMAAGTGPGACYTLGKYQVFVAGTTNDIYHTSGNGSWSAWEDIGGSVAVPPASQEAKGGSGAIPSGAAGGGGSLSGAHIWIGFKESNQYAWTANVNTSVTITGQAGYTDSKGNFIAGKPYTGKLWRWEQEYASGKGGASTQMGQFTPNSDGTFTWSITSATPEEIHYNVGFVASDAVVGGTKVVDVAGHYVTETTSGSTTTTAAHWSTVTSYIIVEAGCPFCAELENELGQVSGFKYQISDVSQGGNNYGYGGNFPGLVLCNGQKVSSPGGSYAENAQALLNVIRANCWIPASSSTSGGGTKKVWVDPTYKTIGGTTKPTIWAAKELVMKWTTPTSSGTTDSTNPNTSTPTIPKIAQTPAGFESPDVSLTPVLPIPPAVAEGITVVLRDHKKAAGTRRQS